MTGATGFVGGHVARMLAERGDDVRVTYRDRGRLGRLGHVEHEPVKADVLDRSAMRRALKGADLLFHSAGYVASRPVRRVWEVNALGPRIAVEAAASEGIRRVILTSSVGGIGPAPNGSIGSEEDFYRPSGRGLTYPEAKHEGEAEALAAAARLGVEVVIVNPAYVLGVPVDRAQPGETSTRTVGHYLRGRLPAVVDGSTNIVHVEDVAKGHLLAADKGAPGQRYVLGGQNVRWVAVLERIARLSGVHNPVVVLPVEVAHVAGLSGELGLPSPIAAEAFVLMAANWCYSSAKAKKELGYRPRGLDATLRETVDWYMELIEAGAFARESRSVLSLGALGVRAGARLGMVRALRAAERYSGRRLVVGA